MDHDNHLFTIWIIIIVSLIITIIITIIVIFLSHAGKFPEKNICGAVQLQ